MEEQVEVNAKALVDDPDAVEVTRKDERQATVVRLKVAPDDMGKVIGKHGRIAKALRTVVKAAASKTNEKIVVQIVQ